MRFITLRKFDQIAYSCRIVDFLALMAALTLLLAHLASHQTEGESPLAHQVYSDRAMIEQVQDNMKEVNFLNSDALSAESAHLVRRPLDIELGATENDSNYAAMVIVQKSGPETAQPSSNDDAVVSVHISYFGVIKIAREGMTKEVSVPQATATTNLPDPLHLENKSRTINTECVHGEPQICSPGRVLPIGVSRAEHTTPVDAGSQNIEAHSMVSQAVPNVYARTQVQLGDLPNPSTGNDVVINFTMQPQSGSSSPTWTVS